jgi:uncharacterized protein YjbI with pentapeptide repeats
VHRLRFAIRDAKARADVEDNFRKTIGQLLGGAAVLMGACFAYVQFHQQQQAAHDVLISNQVAKGFELLGHKDKDEVRLRLGGIYALEGVMNASDQYHQPVLETLCAFVRDQPQTSNDAPPATDIQAALTVIGRRKPGLGEVDLSGAHIVKASLIGADLSHADLSHAHLGGADLSHADLRGADLSHADLSQADLSRASLFHAHLSGADLSIAILRHAILSGADLSGTDLSVADLSGADLSGANLSGAKLSGDLSGANLSRADLGGADLGDADASIDLSGANLSHAHLGGAGAHLSGANLSGANLGGADLGDVDLSRANLSGANLGGAHLSDVDLSRAINLNQDQLDTACGDENTTLDSPLTIKPCPPPKN